MLEVPHAVGKLVHADPQRRRRRRLDIGRHVDGDGGVGLHLADHDVEGRKAVLGLHDVPRKLDAAEVRVIGIGDLDRIIADHFIGRQIAHLLDEVLGVERRLELAAIDADRDGVAVHLAGIRQRGLDHAMRRRPQSEQALLGRARIGSRLVAGLLPGKFAADDLDRALIRRDRPAPPPPRGGCSPCERTWMSRIPGVW